MTQNIERAKSRLNNIQAIEPLLVALRTLSMGTWQTAVNKINGLNQYEKNFNPILSEILPHITDPPNKNRGNKSQTQLS